MNRILLLLTLGGALVLACSGIVMAQTTTPASSEKSAQKQDVRPDHYIVVLKEDNEDPPKKVAEKHAQKYGASDVQVSHVYENALKGYAAKISPNKLEKVKAEPEVQSVTEDTVEQPAAQTMPTGVQRIDTKSSPTAAIAPRMGADPDVDIAIVDSGIDSAHPDLNIKGGYNCTTNSTGAWTDKYGHGTHVAGIAAAKDNSVGTVGVAPGARLWALKTFGNNGTGYASWLICGIDQITKWKTDNDPNNDIEVANYSGGGSGTDTPNCGKDSKGTIVDPKHYAICNSVAAGVTYTIAAGNESGDFARWTPAAYDEVLTVTSLADFNGQPGGGAPATCLSDVDDTGRTTSDTATAGTSDVGHTIAAPGACIYSTYKGKGYTTMSGTSMASPHVAGAAALCIASRQCSDTDLDGKVEPSEVMTKLLSDASTKSDPLASPYYGFTDDPNSQNGSRYYGHLVHVGGY